MTTEHPEAETLAALVDGRLTADEAASVRQHVADCLDCFDVVSGTIEFQVAEKARPVPVPWRRIAKRTAPWLAAAAALVFAFVGLQQYRGGRPDGLERMVHSVGARRLVEPRVGGGFAYAPFPSAHRGPAPIDKSDPSYWPIFEAAALIQKQAARPDAGDGERHALGLAHLLVGKPDEAIATLEEVARSRPQDPLAYSDLAAAFLVRADATQGAEDLVRAIDAARHAVAIDEACAEARFNLALALERQFTSAGTGLPADPGTAIQAWQDYLKIDSASPWADEARQHLTALRSRSESLAAPPDPDAVEKAARAGDAVAVTTLVRSNPRIGLDVLARRLLPDWANAWKDRHGTAAAEALAAAAILGQAIEGVTGDPLWSEAVRAVQNAAGASGGQATLAEAQITLARAIDLYESDRSSDAIDEFRVAANAFERGRSPLQWWAALHVAFCDYYEERRAEARRKTDDLASVTILQRYPTLLGRLHWSRGMLRAVTGDLSDALDEYRAALSLFERTGEIDRVGSSNFLFAELLDLLGDREGAWHRRATSLSLATRAEATRRRMIHLDAVNAALLQDRPWAALAFQAPLFEPWGVADPAGLGEAYLTRARVLVAIGDKAAALADLDSAGLLLTRIVDFGHRERLQAELSASRGMTLAGSAPGEAIGPLEEAVSYFEKNEVESRLPDLYLDLGRAHEALGAYGEAEAEYERGVEVLEAAFARLVNEPVKISFLDRGVALFDAITALEAGALSNPDRAFFFAEKARRAELIAPDSGSTSEVSGPGAIAGALKDDVAVVYLAVVPEHLLRWVFRDGRSVYRPQEVATATIDGLVASLRGAADRRDEAAFRTAAMALYDLLLRPIADLLPRSGALYLVPDRRLDDVPYAALIDREDGEYVIERHAVGIAPSAEFLVARSGGAGAPPGASPRALVVGDPAFDRARHPGLAPLPGAEAEARQVASLYPGSTLLVGPDATAAGFVAGMKSADVIHFAGHAIVNDRYPLLSALVMAAEREDEPHDLLTALELQKAATRAPRAPRLVVLGACRATGGGTERPGAGFSLARPFLAAGVPEIVGTLWAVGDRPAGAILTAFHDESRRGSNAVFSLRAAQLSALRGIDPETRSPLAWGAFLVNGTPIHRT